ncbi:hypothetical protein FGIG_00757 [Fasciola gigantica]|uniref:P-type ATPase N-terminal domain-containing protein n=1 Tax=Fasciola gigantica TaxID=46835 RepID=A0A504Z0L4_FASGI|nr:hypothetical protein FGIG_00757 [Fasciola gigantica]
MLRSFIYRLVQRRQHGTDIRIVYANHGPEYLIPETDPHVKICSNAIISSRYTWYNFVPKNLFEQFHNLANVFFALIAIMYVYSNPATSIWSNLGPLIAIISLILIKDGIEDIMRHRPQWITKKAEDLRVGDVIRCDRGEAFPCDIVLPPRAIHQNTYERVTDENWLFEQSGEQFEELAKQLLVKVECQSPCADLDRFEGRMSSGAWTDGEEQDRKRNPSRLSTNLALRGAKLANTDFVIGLVVYTGKETKLSLNGKQSENGNIASREARSNVILLTFILSMIAISLLLAIVDFAWTTSNKNRMCDLHMYDSSEGLSGRANNAQLADELGQVEFLFSDKTGTLTQNVMQLCTCAVICSDGSVEVYAFPGSQFSLDSLEGARLRSNFDTPASTEHSSMFASSSSDDLDHEDDIDLSDGDGDDSSGVINGDNLLLTRRKWKRNYLKPILKPESKLEQVLLLFSLCHTVDGGASLGENNLNLKYEVSCF